MAATEMQMLSRIYRISMKTISIYMERKHLQWNGHVCRIKRDKYVRWLVDLKVSNNKRKSRLKQRWRNIRKYYRTQSNWVYSNAAPKRKWSSWERTKRLLTLEHDHLPSLKRDKKFLYSFVVYMVYIKIKENLIVLCPWKECMNAFDFIKKSCNFFLKIHIFM